jgi:epoxyqueuosine reductase
LGGLSAELKAASLRAGASAAGIAPAEPATKADALHEWLVQGKHGSMSFLRRDEAIRADIRRWYPEARSVLVCAFQYGEACGPVMPEHGLLARYAALEDYHESLSDRMRSVLAWLQAKKPEANGRIFVDSSPVLERAYAWRAGLGWIGRNRLLINEKTGSFFLLAGLALNLELEADEPVRNLCGSCRKCLQACPSRALDEESLDARLCTAYLTVEHKAAIPEERRAGIGNWIAGCDLCQEACPWNAAAGAGCLKPLLPRAQGLEELAALGPSAMCKRFASTPVSRLRRGRLLRNVLLAMGNAGLSSFRGTLETFSRQPDPVLAEAARWGLSRL